MFKMIFFILAMFLFSCAQEKQDTIEDVHIPGWAKTVVWYQIFPERFHNGDTTNDPTIRDMKGGWPYIFPENWQITPWTSDWYKLQPWEKATGKDFYGIQGTRRYGGDLQGVLDKLDYIKDLGITAIYFNPLFESPSLHKYDATMFHHIDNNFGPDPAKDREIWKAENPGDPATWQWTTADKLFLKLISEAHKRGIRIIIDGVFNHVGATFWAFMDVVKNQEKSAYKDWFIIKQWDNPETSENEFEYEGWFGVKDLPEIKEDANGLVEGPAEHIQAVIKRWMDPNSDGDPSDGIDGWRLDVAEKVNINFWRKFHKWVKEVNPDGYITGEIWWEDWRKNKMFNAAPWLESDVFDAVMNYRFGRALKKFVIDVKNKISAQAFVDSLKVISADYPADKIYILQNLMDSHDMERLASAIINPDRWVDHDGSPSQNRHFDIRKPNKQERMKQKLILAMQMTMPGAPMIYYGDEAGMWGGDDPDCRKPMVWPELDYETETAHPFGLKRPTDEVRFDNKLFNWYKKVLSIRNQQQSLQKGSLEFFLIDNEKEILGYKRTLENESIFVLVNNSPQPKNISISGKKLNKSRRAYTDLLTNTKIEQKNSTLYVKLKPYDVLIIQ